MVQGRRPAVLPSCGFASTFPTLAVLSPLHSVPQQSLYWESFLCFSFFALLSCHFLVLYLKENLKIREIFGPVLAPNHQLSICRDQVQRLRAQPSGRAEVGSGSSPMWNFPGLHHNEAKRPHKCQDLREDHSQRMQCVETEREGGIRESKAELL